jgi:hypothetical protein
MLARDSCLKTMRITNYYDCDFMQLYVSTLLGIVKSG